MKPTITFKFENFTPPKSDFTLQDLLYTDRSGLANLMMEDQKGFRFSQVVDSILYYYENNKVTDDVVMFENCDTDTKPYIIPVAVQYSPSDWADMTHDGKQILNKKSVFELINPRYLKDLQDGNAMLLIDQSVEGYSTKWLWKWFHDKCVKYQINPAAILYLTGDQSGPDTYQKWCSINNPQDQIKVISSISLSMYLHKHYMRRNLNIKFDKILDYKSKNKDKLYLFDCTNMRPRPHRVLNFLHMLNSGLLELGNISMCSRDQWKPFINVDDKNFLMSYGLPADILSRLTPEMTPMIAKYNYEHDLSHYYHYVERILDDMYRNSWVSLISESSYFDHEFNNFISEKTFKPIASMQPFMILGSKGVLKYLHRLGFKSFDQHIDESYSDENDGNRFQAIINSIKKIEQINDKVEWYASMKDILEHNHSMFLEVGSKKSLEHVAISNHYFEYFKDKNV